MTGRLEHELQIKEAIDQMLMGLPKEITEYYHNIRISREATTCREYVKKLRHFWNWYGKNYPGRSITEVDDAAIGEYFEHIKYKTDAAGNISRTSGQYNKLVWTALNQFFGFLVARGAMTSNPMSLTERPNKQDVVKRQFFSFDDLNQTLNMVRKEKEYVRDTSRSDAWVARDLLVLYLLMNTGMRRTALCEINVEDISFEDGTITVTDKGDKHQVYIITSDMKELINNWLKHREKLLGKNKCSALFINKNKERLSDKGIYRLVKEYTGAATGRSISPHKLRASFIALYYQASGNDIQATCEAVGHSNIATTSIYITGRNESRKEAMKFMSKNLKV